MGGKIQRDKLHWQKEESIGITKNGEVQVEKDNWTNKEGKQSSWFAQCKEKFDEKDTFLYPLYTEI